MQLSNAQGIYCVLLQPDVQTSLVAKTVAKLLDRRTGLNTEGALSPHVLLAGPTLTRATITQLVNSLDDVLRFSAQFDVVNAGVVTTGGTIGYDLNSGKDGRTNCDLMALAVWINCAMKKLAVTNGVAAGQFSTRNFRASLPITSQSRHALQSTLPTEDFIRSLRLPVPASFTAEVVSLFELASENWSGRWWEATNWTHHRSWHLVANDTGTESADSYPVPKLGGAGWLREKRRDNRLRSRVAPA